MAPGKVIYGRMNTAPNTRDAGLIGGVIVAGPLQIQWLRWPLFKTKHVIGINPEPTGEIRRTRYRRQHLGSRSAKGAMTGKVAGKCRGHKVGSLIWNPGVGMNPFDAAVLGVWIGRRPRPGKNRNLAGR